jgi:NhaP-type Na+/H+ or K+/H+ antiporter
MNPQDSIALFGILACAAIIFLTLAFAGYRVRNIRNIEAKGLKFRELMSEAMSAVIFLLLGFIAGLSIPDLVRFKNYLESGEPFSLGASPVSNCLNLALVVLLGLAALVALLSYAKKFKKAFQEEIQREEKSSLHEQ